MALWEQIQNAFEEALGRRGEAREEYLGSVPAEVSAEVRQMLAAHETSGPLEFEKRFVEEPRLPAQIGSYRVLEMLGRGGMGEVFLAERTDPPQRAAIKVLGAGWHAPEARARFQLEQRILARLDHPGIVPLLDGGFTADGRPYLVMPYVRGEEITGYCDRRSFGVRERLKVFLEAAAAVSHAHRNLVVHRDLKPSNILVTETGSVRLLDFGIAKLLDPAETALTRVDWQVMTLDAAAPEQVRGEAITTATDVHGLGALLYELLTGMKPFRGATPAELRRQIEEQDPELPSSAGRPELRGDLDAIVMKALEKDPARRFRTVQEMADELDRYLRGLPVLSRAPTWRYRAGKFVRRNRPATALALVVVVLLGVLAGLTMRNARRVAEQRDAARLAQRRAERIASFMTNLLLVSTPRQMPEGGLLSSPELLRRAAAVSPELGAGWPASLLMLEGLTFEHGGSLAQARGRYERAVAEARSAQPPDPALVAEAEHQLAAVVAQIEPPEKAVPGLRASLRRLVEVHGEAHAASAAAVLDLAAALEPGPERDRLEQQALEIHQQLESPAGLGTAESRAALARSHLAARRYPQAAAEAERALAVFHKLLPGGHPFTVEALSLLAWSNGGRRQHAAAVQWQRKAIDEQSRTLGRLTLPVAQSLENYSILLALAKRPAEAAAAAAEAYAIFDRVVGARHPFTPNAARHWAHLLELSGRYAEGLTLLQKAEQMQQAISSRADHAELGLIRTRIGVLLLRLGHIAEGMARLRNTVAVMRRVYPQGHVARAEAETELAFATGQPEEAERLMRGVIEWRRSRGAWSEARMAESECGLALALARAGRPYDRGCLAAYAEWGFADPVKLRELEQAFR